MKYKVCVLQVEFHVMIVFVLFILEGREQIIINLELFLGHVLYPIAGPEALTDEECENLPLEVQLLPETKKRVEEKRVKECILDIIYSV